MSPIVSGGSSGGGGGGLGSPILIYRYTVTGAAKASIDTGVDTPDAGTNIWTGGDLLEAYLYARTDEAAVISQVDLTFNNDSGANYTYVRIRANAGVGANPVNITSGGNTVVGMFCGGDSNDANYFSSSVIIVPNYAGTIGYKGYQVINGVGSTGVNNNDQTNFCGAYKSTLALTRMKVIPDTAAKLFKVGSQLLIYKRPSS